MRMPALFFIFMVWSGMVLAEAQWEPVVTHTDPGRVRTWVKDVPGASVKAFRGVVEVPSSSLQVLGVLDGVDDFPRWVFQCKAAKRIAGGGLYLRFRGIWPVTDRDVAVRSEVKLVESQIQIETTASDLMPEHDGYVRIPQLHNRFILEPLAGQGTRITFETFVDPGGVVPAFISNLVAKKGPLVTLTGLKDILSSRSDKMVTLQDLSPLYDPVRAELERMLD